MRRGRAAQLFCGRAQFWRAPAAPGRRRVRARGAARPDPRACPRRRAPGRGQCGSGGSCAACAATCNRGALPVGAGSAAHREEELVRARQLVLAANAGLFAAVLRRRDEESLLLCASPTRRANRGGPRLWPAASSDWRVWSVRQSRASASARRRRLRRRGSRCCGRSAGPAVPPAARPRVGAARGAAARRPAAVERAAGRAAVARGGGGEGDRDRADAGAPAAEGERAAAAREQPAAPRAHHAVRGGRGAAEGGRGREVEAREELRRPALRLVAAGAARAPPRGGARRAARALRPGPPAERRRAAVGPRGALARPQGAHGGALARRGGDDAAGGAGAVVRVRRPGRRRRRRRSGGGARGVGGSDRRSLQARLDATTTELGGARRELAEALEKVASREGEIERLGRELEGGRDYGTLSLKHIQESNQQAVAQLNATRCAPQTRPRASDTPPRARHAPARQTSPPAPRTPPPPTLLAPPPLPRSTPPPPPLPRSTRRPHLLPPPPSGRLPQRPVRRAAEGSRVASGWRARSPSRCTPRNSPAAKQFGGVQFGARAQF